MRTYLCISLLLLAGVAWAQTGNNQPADNGQSSSGAAPAAGQEPTAPSASQFPPLSGLDEPSLEPYSAARSMLIFGAQGTELITTNAADTLNRNSSPLTGATHLLGTAALQRLWERYQFGLDYMGGGLLYAGKNRPNSQVHELGFEARTLWRTGALTLRDSASYLPDGTFTGSYSAGGLEGYGLSGMGAGLGGANGNRFSFFGGGQFAAFGSVPRLSNLAVVDLQQQITPRSDFTLSGGYNLIHFTQATGGLLVDSRQSTAQAGYDHTINRRNKVALIYGFQDFHFPTTTGLTFVTHVVQILYGYQITGRMDLLLGGGPQLTSLSSTTIGRTLKLSGSARASLRYKFPRTSLTMSYNHYNSAADGLFAGAQTDMARLSVDRPWGRRWKTTASLGYSKNRRIQVATVGAQADSYQNGFVGLRLGRTFSRTLQGFLFYDFNDLTFDRSFCTGASPCNRTAMRHAGGVGLSWHPHPIRLD